MHCVLMARSSAVKLGLAIEGLIDADYVGEWQIMIRNVSSEPVTLKVGTAYVQCLFGGHIMMVQRLLRRNGKWVMADHLSKPKFRDSRSEYKFYEAISEGPLSEESEEEVKSGGGEATATASEKGENVSLMEEECLI
jgi:hypothetical protein